VICDRLHVGEHDTHGVKESYRRALTHVSKVAPVFIPASSDIDDVTPYLAAFSGLLFPGGASNVAPGLYGKAEAAGFLMDPARDHVAIQLIRRAAESGTPMLAICRGFQEMNVAFGGTLHANIYEVGHSSEHREDPSEDLVARYRYKHRVTLTEGGVLSTWIGDTSACVNSLHTQGIDTLGNGLAVEASAADGLIEAIRVESAEFAIGVQWHPEVTADSDALSMSLFTRFGDACRRYGGRP